MSHHPVFEVVAVLSIPSATVFCAQALDPGVVPTVAGILAAVWTIGALWTDKRVAWLKRDREEARSDRDSARHETLLAIRRNAILEVKLAGAIERLIELGEPTEKFQLIEAPESNRAH